MPRHYLYSEMRVMHVVREGAHKHQALLPLHRGLTSVLGNNAALKRPRQQVRKRGRCCKSISMCAYFGGFWFHLPAYVFGRGIFVVLKIENGVLPLRTFLVDSPVAVRNVEVLPGSSWMRGVASRGQRDFPDTILLETLQPRLGHEDGLDFVERLRFRGDFLEFFVLGEDGLALPAQLDDLQDAKVELLDHAFLALRQDLAEAFGLFLDVLFLLCDEVARVDYVMTFLEVQFEDAAAT